jgi:excisionase family DNA binding protein
MNLEQQIEQVVAKAVAEAIERELPAKFAALDAPIDPNRTFSYAQAAEYLNVTESCIRERVKAGELEAIQLGKYKLIPHASIRDLIARERAKLRFERDQKAQIMPADVDDDIAELLNGRKAHR